MRMKTRSWGVLYGLSLLVVLPVAAGPAVSVPVGGPLRAGEARPPLYMRVQANVAGYSPAQIRQAYGVSALTGNNTTGSGQTVAIVDAYGDSSIQQDVANFSSYFGLGPASLTIAYPQGAPRQRNSGWALETALDVEWAHALAPGANILLVVAKSSSLNNLLGAVDYAVNHGAKVVSMSWGTGDFSSETAYDFHFNVAGVTFVASSGDNGESTSVEWPAASPFVVSVGGTSLTLDSSGNRVSETAWSGSGGGISAYESFPACQAGWDQYAAGRGVPDVSFVGDPSTGVAVLEGGTWYVVGGTSVGAPQWAALVALSNGQRNSGSLSQANTALYSQAGTAGVINSTYLVDITAGNDGGDVDDYAVAGYDLVTGLGSPVANNLVPALATH
jgi:subtilase family serine protease